MRSFPNDGGSVPRRAVRVLDASALTGNYRILRKQAGPGCELLPMIKADAYGHGDLWCARTLAGESGLAGFGVATLEEGIRLREQVKRPTRILVFSGTTGFADATGRLCERHGLTPVLADFGDWMRFVAGGWPGRVAYHLKFNTGMNRLGIEMTELPSIRRELASRFKAHPGARPEGILTHLAASEDPRSTLTRRQIEAFKTLRAELSEVAPAAVFHFANSGAIWNARELRLSTLSNWARPGLSLYGIEPWPGAPARGLKPVMTVRARVLQVRRLVAGERVGYGGDFKVSRSGRGGASAKVRVATLGMGYGDGLLRASGHGAGSFYTEKGARRLPIAGRISMDLSAVTGDVKAGDWVEYLGPRARAWDQARAVGTIPYELFTALTSRVIRLENES